MGLNASLYTAARSLELFSAGIQVAGNNVANANTPNYVREQLMISTAPSYQMGGLLFGTGAHADGVRQQIDLYLESQIHLANADVKSAEVKVKGYSQLQLILGELGDHDLSSTLNHFLDSLNQLVNQPELQTNRQQVIGAGQQLAGMISSMRGQLDSARTSVNAGLDDLVKEANSLIQEISTLNTQIVNMESAGLLKSDAGGLRTQRLNALNRLSEIIPIRTVMHENGIVDVFTGHDYLVLPGVTNTLETYREADRGVAVDFVRLSKTQSELQPATGEIAGVLETRDHILGGFADQLDQYALAVIQEMNRLHASGEGVAGFTAVTGTYEVADASVPLNQAGLLFPPTHGSFEIKIFDTVTQTTQTTTISLDLDGLGGNDTSPNDLQTLLNGVEHLQASIDPLGRLSLRTDAGFEVRFSNDTSGVLSALGMNTFFQGTDANSIAVNDTLVRNHNLLATGQGGGSGDNSNAVLLAKFAQNNSALLGGNSIDKFYELMTAQIADGAAAETALSNGFRSFQSSLFGQRQQISGVSLDEEAIRIMEMQHGYMAAARIVSTIGELFETLVRL